MWLQSVCSGIVASCVLLTRLPMLSTYHPFGACLHETSRTLVDVLVFSKTGVRSRSVLCRSVRLKVDGTGFSWRLVCQCHLVSKRTPRVSSPPPQKVFRTLLRATSKRSPVHRYRRSRSPTNLFKGRTYGANQQKGELREHLHTEG